MTKTIQAALAPLLITGSFCSVAFFEYPIGRPRLHVTFLYLLIMWSLYAYLFYYVTYTSYTAYIYINWSNSIMIFIAITSILVSLYHFKEIKTCLRKLSIVDDTLEMLGTPKEYQRLHNWTIRIIIGWSVLFCLALTMDSVFLNYDYSNITRIFAPFISNYFLYVITYSDLIWGIILGYISSRFQRINEHIHDLIGNGTGHIKERNKLSLIRQQRTGTKKYTLYIWAIMHVHLHLCLISREINKVFSVQMTLQMACYYTIFVETTLEIYTLHVDWNTATFGEILNIICCFIWTFLVSTKLVILNHICQIIRDKANETIAVLSKLSNDSLNEDLREQKLQFILQIKHREIKFSGMGLFHLGYNFVRQSSTNLIIRENYCGQKFCHDKFSFSHIIFAIFRTGYYFYVSIATIMVITIQMRLSYTYARIVPPINN